jgi:stage II sporulation protein D
MIFGLTPLSVVGQEASALPPDAIARFHLNNGSYLVETGKFLEAIEEYQTAQSVASSEQIKAESLAAEAQVRALFLDDPAGALACYRQVIDRHRTSSFYENALFQAGMLAFQSQKTEEARTLFRRYLSEFPRGSQVTTAEFMRDQAEEYVAKKELPPLPAAPPIAKEIRVGLGEHSSLTLVSAEDIRLDGLQAPPVGKRAAVQRQSSRFVIGGTPASEVSVEFVSSAPIQVAGRAYRGRIRLQASAGDRFLLVNRVPIEEYVGGVVNAEMPSSFPAEAQKAQAVATRTYALYNTQHPVKSGIYDVYADTRSQVYGGVARETATGRAAVATTAGEVLFHQDRPILAYFDSNNGGKTADPGHVFDEPRSYLAASDDPYSRNEPLGRWQRSFTGEEIRAALGQAGYNVGTIQSLQAVRMCPSGRIVTMAVVHSAGKLELRTRTQFRCALNRAYEGRYKPEVFPDILMVIEKKDNGFLFTGGGYGHGVGLSQYGCRGRARAGQNYRQILAAYYPGTELRKT